MLSLELRASSQAVAMRPSGSRSLIVVPSRSAVFSHSLGLAILRRSPALPAARQMTTSAIRRAGEISVNPEPFDPLHCPISIDAEEVLKDPLMAAGYLYFDSVFPIKVS